MLKIVLGVIAGFVAWSILWVGSDEVLERIYIGRRFKNDTERLEKLGAKVESGPDWIRVHPIADGQWRAAAIKSRWRCSARTGSATCPMCRPSRKAASRALTSLPGTGSPCRGPHQIRLSRR